MRMVIEMAVIVAMAVSMSVAVVASAVGAVNENETVDENLAATVASLSTVDHSTFEPPMSYDELAASAGIEVASAQVDGNIVEEPVEAVETVSTVTTTRLGVKVTSYDEDANYTAIIDDLYSEMQQSEDPAAIEHMLGLLEIYEAQRNLKVAELYPDDPGYSITEIFTADHSLDQIDDIMNPPFYPYTDAELKKVAAVVTVEAGSDWATDEHQRAVASVILNRVLDPRFPDSIMEVIYADGQYPGTCHATKYSDRALTNAQYVLENGPTHDGVWQANFPQGSETIQVYEYLMPVYSKTYICR